LSSLEPQTRTDTGVPVPASLAAMLDQLEPAQLKRLEIVLRAKLRTAPTKREEREHELGVLNAMLAEAGLLEHPRPHLARGAYDRDRPEDAPRSARLVERYGSWFDACKPASSLNLAGGTKGAARPWPSKHRGGHRGRKFTREEIIEAVIRCAAVVDRVPSSNVYYDWAARERRRARERGGRLPRLPAQGSVERHFGSWSEVRAAVTEVLDAPLVHGRLPIGASKSGAVSRSG
jgi:hypothetical protein